MRKITGLVIILVIIILGSYYGMGVITERTLKKNLEMVNQSNGVSVQLTQFDRGWFHSKANLHWSLHIPASSMKQANGQMLATPAKNYKLDMPVKIYHGPIIYADSKLLFGFGYARTKLTLPQEYLAEFEKTYASNSIKPEMNLGIFVTYLNKTYLHADVPKFKLITKQDGGQFEWLGMMSDLRISQQMNQIDGSITIDGINFTKHQLQGRLGKITSDYDLHRTANGLYLGDAKASLPSFVVHKANQKIFEVKDFDVHSKSEVNDGLFSSSLEVTLDKLFNGGKTYGPGEVEVAVKKLDAQVLGQINQQVTQIQQGPVEERQRGLLSLIPELPKLLNKGAQFEIVKLKMSVPQGNIEGDMQIALPNGDLGNPFQLLQKIKGNGRLDIAAEVLKAIFKEAEIKKLIETHRNQSIQAAVVPAVQPGAPPQSNAVIIAGSGAPVLTAAELEQKAMVQSNEKIAALVKAGALVAKEKSYLVEVKLAQGQLLVNGKPFNPAMMQF